ncbi:MAG: DUF188 domain-containing protein [Bacilli bacterium]
MRIVIDGDAMPSIDLIENVAKKYGLECFIFCDFTHNINSNYSKITVLSQGYQNVDMKILEFIKANDIVITNDYGLASLCLNTCFAMDSKGLRYTNSNIDILLQNRYLNLKSKKKKGPKKRTNLDNIKLVTLLEEIINKYGIIK